MASSTMKDLRVRKNYAKIPTVIDIPDLINIQKVSYEKFLQKDLPPEKREHVGLQAIFKSVFPITDFNKTSSLEFVSYHLEDAKYDVEECRSRGMTFAAPIKVLIRLVIWETNQEAGTQSIRDVKEQEVYFGEIPLMTEHGTFVINGTERVVVSQLHRSPGAFFEHDKGKTHSSGKLLYSARVIPYRGSWIDFEFDHKDVLYVRIDRRRKMHATILLRALGYSTQELLNYFYDSEAVSFDEDGNLMKDLNLALVKGQRTPRDIVGTNGQVLVRKNFKFTESSIRKLRKFGPKKISIDPEEIEGRAYAHDIIDEETGEVVFECGDTFEVLHVEELRERGVEEVRLLFEDNVGPYFRQTLMADKVGSPAEAVLEIYRRLRPGDPSTETQARNYFKNLFFNNSRYDLSPVGRLKLNYKFKLDEPLTQTVLTNRDVLEVVRYLISLRSNQPDADVDDIDHLGNRRVRAVGELMENQYRIGLVRMERAIKERMSMSQEIDTLMPHDLINAKPVSAVVKEYFGSSQLSQFMDQTNPLSEVTHKRRLSALGPGGLTRDRAGFEVRDVHGTHYGRICPIETPEGPNIGLIASLSTYARVNSYGFIETPYRLVEDGVVTDEVKYFSALEEEEHTIAQAHVALDKKNAIVGDWVAARRKGEFVTVRPAEISLVDVSPNQLVSVAASLIPFLENDDANRALMGSNMQRQAVPLLRTESPFVGTDLEGVVAGDSGVTVTAKQTGTVETVDSSRIVIRGDEESSDDTARPDIHNLIKYQRSNQNTCINQKPIVRKGDHVTKGDVVADGPATELGELALGQNVIVAFMPWGGYNFEDSILLSEEMVRDDYFTSVHIEEFECIARDTKLGKEEITRDIPNVGEEAMKNLDGSGIIRLGAEVKSNDILAGKVTPKGETQLSPEEKLLRAIFGEKAGDVRDSSLRVPPGVVGTVIDAKVFSRKGVDKDERHKAIEGAQVRKLEKDRDDEIKILETSAGDRIRGLLIGQTTSAKLVRETGGEVLVGKGEKLTAKVVDGIPSRYWPEIRLTGGAGEAQEVEERIQTIYEHLEDQIHVCKTLFGDKIKRLQKGDELPPGVIKMVKISIAIKRKLQVGDKMAGRHGNKGVVSRILPVEDMPYLPDGTPVQLVLNPLGVPSRMNVGQILESHMGWAAANLGWQIAALMEKHYSPSKIRKALKRAYDSKRINKHIDSLDDDDVLRLANSVGRGIHLATPVFDGASEKDITDLLERAGVATSGQTVLFDGRTGDAFDGDVTVGVMYMLKLHHLVDDKIHARSIGPYSLVTQQPLGGKAQFGGQRLGEMEVWAMEAYGAAYALQEFLTVKSDDVVGRTRMYEAIVKGENTLEAGLPESFNVLLRELKSLALNVELLETGSPS